MSTINERFREAREHLKLSQEEFASKANRTRSEIKNIEYNKTTPKEEVIAAVIKAHNINPKFIREGKMPIEMPSPDEDTAYINDLLNEIDNPFIETIKAIMIAYNECSPEDQKVLKNFAKSFANKTQKENRD